MKRYPEYIEIKGKRYKINTDFRVAIECNEIANDSKISDYERAMGILIKLFGTEIIDDGRDDFNVYSKALDLAQKYLSCGKEIKTSNDDVPDMDYVEDMDYIEASFMSDYNIDLSNIQMHWWKFYNLLNGLSNSELGNCCVLNRIRNLRNYDLSEIKDVKERQKIKKAQEQVALKKNKKENNLTEKQKKSLEELNEILGI